MYYEIHFLSCVSREMKVAKTPEPQKPVENVPDLPAGLLGLEIPQDIRNVLKVVYFFEHGSVQFHDMVITISDHT